MPPRSALVSVAALFLAASTLAAQSTGQDSSLSAPASAPQEPIGAPVQQQAADSSYTEAIQHGVDAFKAADYEHAMQHFREAVLFNPTSSVARLYLGKTYSMQVVPYLDTPENLAIAANAIDTLRSVSASAPEYLTALRQIAAVQRDTKRADDARRTELQVLRLDPTDAEAHYTLGVVDWQQAYRNAVAALAAAGLQDDGQGNPRFPQPACTELRAQNTSIVADGIEHLTAAIRIRPDYDDAMTYLNLTWRRRADFACGDGPTRLAAIAEAEQWADRAQKTRSAPQASGSPAASQPQP